MKKHIITFTDISNPDGVLDKPKPASEYIPDWYKNAKSYLNDNKKVPQIDGSSSATVKRCMPLFDMMTAGYILETPDDIYVRNTEDGPYFQWLNEPSIGFQPKEQLQDHPWFFDQGAGITLVNPWSIKTPNGWSVLIINPTHRESGIIEIIPGIVDTDDYSRPSNIFIKLVNPSFEGMIPKGTPFAQIIPLKRESWESELGTEKERKKYIVDTRKFNNVFFDRYKKMWWKKKSYK